jgi:hypothetical protein
LAGSAAHEKEDDGEAFLAEIAGGEADLIDKGEPGEGRGADADLFEEVPAVIDVALAVDSEREVMSEHGGAF